MLGNAKLGRTVWTFSLPSGHTCPGACSCLAKVDFKTNKLTDGPQQRYRCFSATSEVAFRNTREARRFNLNMLRKKRTAEDMATLLLASLPETWGVMRVHVGGDFYSQAYFDAWMLTAQRTPRMKFYGYTKSIPFWINWINRHGALPKNFFLTASLGGKFDDLIKPYMVTAEVVEHPDEAKAKGKKIDHTDALAQNPKKDFALLIHSIGAPGSSHAKAIKRLKDEGIEFSYKRPK